MINNIHSANNSQSLETVQEIPPYIFANKIEYPIDSLGTELLLTTKDAMLLIFWLLKYPYQIRKYRSLKKFRNSKSGRNALILGNGPSVNLIKAEIIKKFQEKNGDVFAVNHFYLNKEFQSFIPDFYFSSDPATHMSSDFKITKRMLQTDSQCKIFTPMNLMNTYTKIFPKSRLFGFCNIEVRRKFLFSNSSIRPDRPHSYASMTLYNALAVAVWMNYDKIFVLGLDNTYLSDVFCDENNQVFNILRHAGINDRIQNVSSEYKSIFDYFYEHSRLFYDLKKFANYNIVNLDKTSLVDTFIKADKVECCIQDEK